MAIQNWLKQTITKKKDPDAPDKSKTNAANIARAKFLELNDDEVEE